MQRCGCGCGVCITWSLLTEIQPLPKQPRAVAFLQLAIKQCLPPLARVSFDQQHKHLQQGRAGQAAIAQHITETAAWKLVAVAW